MAIEIKAKITAAIVLHSTSVYRNVERKDPSVRA